jgi:branched-subunit amino acid aminotransferase/4-amino-4-deoxychorismate lyase
MPPWVYQDGLFLKEDEVRLPPSSPAFQCGFTLFETLLADAAGRTFRLEAHLARLARSAAAFGLAPVPLAEEIREAAARLCRENGISTGRLRVILAHRGRGFPASRIVTAVPYDPPSEADCDRGWGCRTASYRIYRGSPASGHKTGDFLEARLFRDGLPPATEGIVLNDAGRVCEGCFSNVFVAEGGTLLTPPVDEGCLPGVTRAAVIEIATGLGIPYREEAFLPERLASADEAFLTNSLIGVMPLTRFEGEPIGPGKPGPSVRRIGEGYSDRASREAR